MSTHTEVDSAAHSRVLRGAKVLDERLPGWAHHVSHLTARSMESMVDCVMGQLTRSPWVAEQFDHIECERALREGHTVWAFQVMPGGYNPDLGFDLSERGADSEWAELAYAWNEQIDIRT